MKYYVDSNIRFRGQIVALQIEPGTSAEDSQFLKDQFEKFFNLIIEESQELRAYRTAEKIKRIRE